MTTEIGFGIVGCGMIGKVQAEAIASIPGARLVAACARDEKRVTEFAAAFGATAARAGKHVLVEKPIETSLEKADALIEACDRAGVKLGVIFQSRFLPAA